jgi:hypothetical protein
MAAETNKKFARIQILQGNENCFYSNNPVILSGEFAYEKDTKKLKIGDGVTNWRQLPYIETLTQEMITIINNASVHLNLEHVILENGKIPKIYLPEGLNATIVVKDVAERNSVHQTKTLIEGQTVYVVDATADPTVDTGGAIYIWTGTQWDKIAEMESMDLDFSDFYSLTKHTLDNVKDGNAYVRLTKEERKKLEGIEDHATGDLTADEVAALYESVHDVNRFSNKDKGKLEGIESGATNDPAERIREKLHSLAVSLRLNADYVDPGQVHKFFTEKERKELDVIIAKLATIETGATKDTAVILRDKLKQLSGTERLLTENIHESENRWFLKKEQLDLIVKITEIIDNINKNKSDIQINKKEIEILRGLITKNEGSISELKKLIEKTDSELRTYIDRLISELKEMISKLETRIKELESKIKENETKITEINRQLIVIIERIDKLEGAVKKNSGDIVDIYKKIGQIEIDITEIKKSITDIRQEIHNLEINLTNYVDEQISKLKAEITITINNNKTEINNKFDTEITNINKKIEKIKIEINESLTKEVIKARYESNDNSNAFTDNEKKKLGETQILTLEEKQKLAGIEKNADVTDSENVRAAGAIMEGDIIFGGECSQIWGAGSAGIPEFSGSTTSSGA